MNKLIFDLILISFRLNFLKKCIVYIYIHENDTKTDTLCKRRCCMLCLQLIELRSNHDQNSL